MDDGQMFHTDDTFTCDFSHDDESMFATGSDDGTVGFWNVWNFKKLESTVLKITGKETMTIQRMNMLLGQLNLIQMETAWLMLFQLLN